MLNVSTEDVGCLNMFLEEAEVQYVLTLMERFNLKKHSVLFQPGTKADGVFFIVHGQLAIQVPTGFKNKMQVVALLTEGSLVGEGGVLESVERRATVMAIEDSALLYLGKADYLKLERERPEIAIKFVKQFLTVSHRRLLDNSERLAHVL